MKKQKKWHFAVYSHNLVIKNSKLVTRNFIVLVGPNDEKIFTNYHKYIGSPNHRIKRYTDDGNNRADFIVKFLNYSYFEEGIEKLTDLEINTICNFLNKYGLCSLETDNEYTHRTVQTVKRCVNVILDFVQMLLTDKSLHFNFSFDDLFKYKNVRNKYGTIVKVKVPLFSINYVGTKKQIFRDIPNKAFNIMFNYIADNHIEILGLIMLSAFAGLRPSEACNVRRTDSPLGPGILFEYIDGEVCRIEIDIREELNLRSDLISVGKIKKERKQQVPFLFQDAFISAYNKYLEYANKNKFEQNFGAFTVNKQGKALSYDSYRMKFQQIVKNELVPLFLADHDPEIAMYGRILLENRLSPHVFRHWYTVQLVLSGMQTPGELMFWRGDTSPESSLTYLQNKGDLQKQYQKVNNEVFDYLLWATGRINDD